MSVTIKQIALRAGLSVPTVSRILNNDSELFRPETRERVLKAARELGYRPNSYRMALRTKRFNAIGLLVGEHEGAAGLCPATLRTLLTELHGRNQHLVMGAVPAAMGHLAAAANAAAASLPPDALSVAGSGAAEDPSTPKMLREWSVDGILIACSDTTSGPQAATLAERVRGNKIPAVWLNRRMATDCVYPDDRAGTAEAVERLMSLGHKRVALLDLGSVPNPEAAERRAGFESAAGRAGEVVAPKRPIAAGDRFDFVADWLGKRRGDGAATAVVCVGSTEASVLFTAALAAGLAVPKDISIVAIADDPVECVGSRITTMVLPGSEVAIQGLAALADKIADPAKDVSSRALPLTYAEGVTLAPPGGV